MKPDSSQAAVRQQPTEQISEIALIDQRSDHLIIGDSFA
jgi:hypothetical protein